MSELRTEIRTQKQIILIGLLGSRYESKASKQRSNKAQANKLDGSERRIDGSRSLVVGSVFS